MAGDDCCGIGGTGSDAGLVVEAAHGQQNIDMEYAPRSPSRWKKYRDMLRGAFFAIQGSSGDGRFIQNIQKVCPHFYYNSLAH